MKSFLFLLTFQFVFLSQGYAQEIQYVDYYCGNQTLQGKPFKYCITRTDRKKNKDIIYFFHGMGSNEKAYFQDCDTAKVDRLMRDAGYQPTVITFTMGKRVVLSEKKSHSSVHFFSKSALPYLENKIGGLQGGRRILIGKSMGGFNAAVVSLKHPEMFQKVALLCPAFSTVSPFDSRGDIFSYIRRTFAIIPLVNMALGVAKNAFSGQEEYKKNDPLRMVSSFHGDVKPKYFVSCGQQDFFGFQEGAGAFAHAAEKNNFDVEYKPVWGGHCNFDKNATANFIMED
jgi:hypothetical protein